MHSNAVILRQLKKAAKKSPDLLGKNRVFDPSNPLAGHCYIMAEAAFHLIKGCKAYVFRTDNDTHWFLRKGNKIIDPTYEQFQEERIPYELGKGCGFLTKSPSKRAYELIKRANLLTLLEPNN